jgi:hypothetical protein
MDRRTLLLILMFAWLASVVAADKSQQDKDNEWMVRLAIDLFNFGVIAYDQCGPHAASGQCKTFMAVFFFLAIVVFVITFVIAGILVMLDISPPSSSSSSRCKDADWFRVFMTANSCAKLWKLFGPK